MILYFSFTQKQASTAFARASYISEVDLCKKISLRTFCMTYHANSIFSSRTTQCVSDLRSEQHEDSGGIIIVTDSETSNTSF